MRKLIILTIFSVILYDVESASIRRCVNKNSDQGICSRPESCLASKGVFLGKCPGDQETACCMKLSCTSEFEEHLTSFRKKRSIPTFSIGSMISTLIDQRCGLKDNQNSQNGPPQGRASQIINGLKVNWKLNPYPWMLGIWEDQQTRVVPSCGAALISTKYAITAAHCISNPENLILRGGSVLNNLPETGSEDWDFGITLDIDKIDVHPQFDPFTFENDIALIKLKSHVGPTRDLYPICLPEAVEDNEITDYEGMEVAVTGWGCMKEQCKLDEQPKHLRESDMHVISNDLAMCWFMNDSVIKGEHEYIPKKLFVIGGDESGSKSTCQGDSGSPVVRPVESTILGTKYEVIGLVSWSKGCGRPFRPSVWTRVETFVPWLRSLMK